MNFFDYLTPTEEFGKAIVLLQICLLFYCLLSFLRHWRFLARVQLDIKQNENVTELSAEILTSQISDKDTTEKTFSDFAERNSLGESSPVFHHLKSLFKAGYQQSNLNVQALNENTINIINGKNQLFRSVVSLFIILGLLGTLWGLAGSLSQLSLSTETTNLDNRMLTDNFRLMLSKLSGAFAPSIWGVGLTIFCVLLSLILQKISSSTALLLERETIGNWGLYLLPTTSQHLFEQLQRSEAQIQKNLESAQKVGEFADVIREDAQELTGTVSKTRQRFKELHDASENLIKFSEKFGESLLNFPTLQTDLHSLNQQMLADSSAIRQNFEKSLTDSQKIQQENSLLLTLLQEHLNRQNKFSNDQYIKQNEELKSGLAGFKFYEESYLESRRNIDESLLKTLKAAEQANQKIGQQNEAVIEGLVRAIGEPLKSELSQLFADVPQALLEVTKKLNQTKIPLDLAAERMSATTEQFDHRTEDLVGGLQREFQAQNLLNKEYLDNLKGIKETIASLNSNLQTFTQTLEKNGRRINQTERRSDEPPSPKNSSSKKEQMRFYERIMPDKLRRWIKER